MLSEFRIRLRALMRRKSVEVELDDELRFHFERQVEKYVQAGMPREEAARRARVEFGGLEQVKEECRGARGVQLLETLAEDVRYGLRVLTKNPGFTIGDANGAPEGTISELFASDGPTLADHPIRSISSSNRSSQPLLKYSPKQGNHTRITVMAM